MTGVRESLVSKDEIAAFERDGAVLLRGAIDFLSNHGSTMDVMVNHVLEVSAEVDMTLYPLPVQEH